MLLVPANICAILNNSGKNKTLPEILSHTDQAPLLSESLLLLPPNLQHDSENFVGLFSEEFLLFLPSYLSMRDLSNGHIFHMLLPTPTF